MKADKTAYTALLHFLAAARGGKCLSPGYVLYKTKYLWRCGSPEHPAWEARIDTLRRGSWCPQCAKKRMTGRPTNIETWMRVFGVQMLDGPYAGHAYCHKWRCLSGHEFVKGRHSMVDAVRHGQLACPECERRRKWLAQK